MQQLLTSKRRNFSITWGKLGEMGSVLRNPHNIAAVLYDLDFAETKGSGIADVRFKPR